MTVEVVHWFIHVKFQQKNWQLYDNMPREGERSKKENEKGRGKEGCIISVNKQKLKGMPIAPAVAHTKDFTSIYLIHR